MRISFDRPSLFDFWIDPTLVLYLREILHRVSPFLTLCTNIRPVSSVGGGYFSRNEITPLEIAFAARSRPELVLSIAASRVLVTKPVSTITEGMAMDFSTTNERCLMLRAGGSPFWVTAFRISSATPRRNGRGARP